MYLTSSSACQYELYGTVVQSINFDTFSTNKGIGRSLLSHWRKSGSCDDCFSEGCVDVTWVNFRLGASRHIARASFNSLLTVWSASEGSLQTSVGQRHLGGKMQLRKLLVLVLIHPLNGNPLVSARDSPKGEWSCSI